MSIVVFCVNFRDVEVRDVEYDAWLKEVNPWPPSPEEEAEMIEYYKKEYPELFGSGRYSHEKIR